MIKRSKRSCLPNARSIPRYHRRCFTSASLRGVSSPCRMRTALEGRLMRQDCTCLLGSKGLTMRFPRSACEAVCLESCLRTGARQQCCPANWAWHKDGEVWRVLWIKLSNLCSDSRLLNCGCSANLRAEASQMGSLVLQIACFNV